MSGEVLENPVTGESMEVLESTPETFRARYVMRPHSEIAAVHLHPKEEQRVSVLSGELHLRIGDAHRIVRGGESATVPPGTPHFQWNPSDSEAVVVEEFHPAGRLHDFFRVLFRLAQEGRTDEKGFPRPLLAAALFSEFRDSIQPEPRSQRLLLRALAPIASALGYRRKVGEALGSGRGGSTRARFSRA